MVVGAEHLDTVSNFLIEVGAPGVELREACAGTEIIAYFSTRPPVAALRVLLTDLGCSPGRIVTRRINDEAWDETWKRRCRPQAVGRRIYVRHSWDAERIPAGRLPVVIDPGMAFGTGDHATTRSCLLLAEDIATGIPPRRVLDCGTGSGILAITLAKLGAAEVWAVDTDPVARGVALANASLNAVADRVHVAASIDAISPPFDLILANLFADLLVELAPRFRGLAAPTGFVVCAGFLTNDAERVAHGFRREGFGITRQVREEGWVALELRGGSKSWPHRSS